MDGVAADVDGVVVPSVGSCSALATLVLRAELSAAAGVDAEGAPDADGI